MNLRILQVVLEPRRAGAEVLAADLAGEFANMGIANAVAGLVKSDLTLGEMTLTKEVETFDFPYSSTRPLLRLRFLRKVFKEFQPNVTFAHTVIPAAYTRIVGPTSSRLVPVLHSATPDYSDRLLACSERILRYRSFATIGVSPKAFAEYLTIVGKEPKNFSVVANGLRPEDFIFNADWRASIRKELEIDTNAVVFTVAARVTAVKNQLAALRIFRDYRKANPRRESVLLLAGEEVDADYAEELRLEISKFGLGPRVKFLGPRNDVGKLLSATDIAVLASFEEANSIALIEYLVSGAAVIASNIRSNDSFGIREGFVRVDPRDPQIDSERLNRLAARRYERSTANEFHISKTALRYLEVAKVAGPTPADRRISS